ncbi:MAG: trypsin-like peptidase domain-containing protein [Chloroflexi bacterium]|nr:trypsin-like peptidase domain-containing protein [Chloroflexota bacterium]
MEERTPIQQSEDPSARREAPAKSSIRQRLARLALIGTLAVTTLGGGAAGSAATLYWLHNQPPPVSAAPVAERAALQTVAATPAATDLATLYQQVAPSVVSIQVTGRGPRGSGGSGEGSGLIVDREGHVLTNNHLVANASRIQAVLNDGARLQATLVGSDSTSDLALLKVTLPAGKGQPATLGDSSAVRPGESAFAVGAPFGLEQTITAGIISAVNRDYGAAGGRPMRGLIQTDAPINPGNSGGPLFNGQGEVIGITTAIESPVRGSVGIGFAIPINTAKRLLPRLTTGARIEHPWLGISGIALTESLAQELGLSVTRGIVVAEAVPNSPAAKAGLRGASVRGEVPRGGDVIVTMDGRQVQSVTDISSYLDTKRVGDQITLEVIRDGKTQQITVTLGAWPVEDREA